LLRRLLVLAVALCTLGGAFAISADAAASRTPSTGTSLSESVPTGACGSVHIDPLANCFVTAPFPGPNG
jgi:hypothetical protein